MKKQEQTIKNDSLKNTIKYGLFILCIFISAAILLIAYGYFISLSRAKCNHISHNQNNSIKTENKNLKIKRKGYLKYSHSTENIASYYLIELIQIDNCDYIILSKNNQAPTIIHSYSCKNHETTK